MAPSNDRLHYTIFPKNFNDPQYLGHTRANSSIEALTVTARAFVVWVSDPGRDFRGFIAWSETAGAELSPTIRDAWRFPSAEAANASLARAFGPVAERFGVAVFPLQA